MIPFPLAEGEAYGRGKWATFGPLVELEHVTARLALVSWQRHVSAAWRFDTSPTGVWNAQCAQATLKIQEAHNIPPSGVLDAETWQATWETGTRGQATE